jgi:ABC-type thiamin/hydroxymethylpyrimidine transport system permease subunit
MPGRITTLEATFVVLMAACGVALKPIVGPMAKIVGAALFVPSGTIAGAIYMMWPTLAALVVRRFGSALLVGLIEGIVVLITGFYGSHGIFSLVVYVTPCVFIDVGFLVTRRCQNRLTVFIPPALGNTAGTVLVAVLIMHLPTIPLLVSLVPAFIFGGLGGWLALGLYLLLVKSYPQFSGERRG